MQLRDLSVRGKVLLIVAAGIVQFIEVRELTQFCRKVSYAGGTPINQRRRLNGRFPSLWSR